MIKIKYNNKKSFEEVSFSRNNNVVTITPTTQNINGFTTWRMDGKTQLGDFQTLRQSTKLMVILYHIPMMEVSM